MSPPISKDWWVAAAITGAALPAAIGQTAPAATRQPAGVISGAQAGQPASVQPLYMDAASGQRVVTGPGQTVHVLFPDQSALTVGPNSDITISRLEYDARNKNGSIVLDMTRGLLRVVGGFISKRNEIQVRTATATVGIRGGITIMESNGQNGSAHFLFGQRMRVSGSDGQSQTITRAGFGTNFGGGGGGGGGISSPFRSNLNQLLGGFGGGGGQGGGQGGGTLTGDGDPNLLGPDRHGSNNPNDPANPGGNKNGPPDMRDVLGGQAQPGNQS